MTTPVSRPPPPAVHVSATRTPETTARQEAPGPTAALAASATAVSHPSEFKPGAVNHTTFSVDGQRGTKLHVQVWRPQGPPKGVFVISHGLKSHSGRYDEVAREMTQRGWVVYAHDHRGHGKSGGGKVDVESFDDYVKDLKTVHETARRNEPGLQTVLYGHSMGGQIATRYALDHKPDLAGLVLASPALGEPTGADKVKAAAARFLTWVGGGGLRVFELGTDGFSRNPAVTRSMQNDPLIYGNGTARLATEIIGSVRSSNARARDLSVPLLAIHGDQDKITAPEATQKFVESVGRSNATFQSLPGYVHDPLFDVDANVPRQLVYDQADKWLAAKSPNT